MTDRADRFTIVPASDVPWDDLQAILGTRGDPARCQCQWYKIPNAAWRSVPVEERRFRLRDQTDCGNPGAPTTGLIAYLHGEPVGWCNVEPRTEFDRLLTMRLTWAGRAEDRADAGVWSVTCFVTRAGYRRRGVMRALTAATVGFARDRGAHALEAYPMITQPEVDIPWGELHHGSRNAFLDAGFREVVQPTKRRSIVRIDFDAP